MRTKPCNMKITETLNRHHQFMPSTVMLLFFGYAASYATGYSTIESNSLIDSVTRNLHIEQCCSTTLKECLKIKPECTIASHLYSFSEWLIEKGNDYNKITEQVNKRYIGFSSEQKFEFDTSNLQWAGSPSAPVRIEVYISSSCNSCKHIVGEIYDSVTAGSLAGKVKLFAIPFGTGIGDIALFAANSEGKFWQMFLAMRANKARYKIDDILQMALATGISEKRMREMLNEPEFKKMVSSSRAEGSRNGVEITPTFFINEKRYRSYKDPVWIIDAAKFELRTTRSVR